MQFKAPRKRGFLYVKIPYAHNVENLWIMSGKKACGKVGETLWITCVKEKPRINEALYFYVCLCDSLGEGHSHVVQTRSVVGIKNKASIECSQADDRLAHAKEHSWRKTNTAFHTCSTESCSIL